MNGDRSQDAAADGDRRDRPRLWRRLYAPRRSLRPPFRDAWDDAGPHLSAPLERATRPWPPLLVRRIGNDDTPMLHRSDAPLDRIPTGWFDGARLPDDAQALLDRHVAPLSTPTATTHGSP